MTLAQKLLAGLVAVELVAGLVLVGGRFGSPPVPRVDPVYIDPPTAADIDTLVKEATTPAGWGRLGEAYLVTGYFPEAEACLRRAADLDPGNAQLRYKHAFAAERIGRLDDADAGYRAAAAAGSRRAADSLFSVGRNRLRAGDADAAAAAFREAGDLPAAKLELALLAQKAGRLDEAKQIAARLAADFPKSQEPVSILYRLAVAKGDAAQAAILADRFDHRPERLNVPFMTDSTWVYQVFYGFGRGKLITDAKEAFKTGRYAQAEAGFRTAQESGWDAETADQLAESLFRQGRPADAAAVFADAVERSGPSFGLLWRHGQALNAAGKKEEARKAWERADTVVSGPWARELWLDLANAADERKDAAAATGYRARVALAAGMTAAQSGKRSEAVAPLTEATKVPTTRVAAWFYLGEVARADARYSDAKAAYQECLNADPDHGRARRALALCDP